MMLTVYFATGDFLFTGWEFPLELFCAIILFVCAARRRKRFALRASLFLAAAVGVWLFVPDLQGFIHMGAYGKFGYAYSVFWLIAIVLEMAAGVWLCFDVSIWFVMFCCIAGYCAEHCAYSLYVILNEAVLAEHSLDVLWMQYIIMGTCYIALYFAFGRRVKNLPARFVDNKSIIAAGLAAMAVTVGLSMYVQLRVRGVVVIIIRCYAIISCLVLLVLLFTLSDKNKLVQEKAVMKYMWKRDKEHYVTQKENIDIINMKIHDLKHSYIRCPDEEMAASIANFDAVFSTGNEALDVVLTEKNYECIKYGIGLTCLIDGADIAFMDDGDVYSLFGNILDNAIAAVSGLDAERRQITLTAKVKGKFLSISEENYYDGVIEIRGGEILSSDSDRINHGFGIKSIKYVAQKYGGTVGVTAERGVYGIHLLFSFR